MNILLELLAAHRPAFSMKLAQSFTRFAVHAP
ncbi:hypothetical protein B1M_04154 [Burkholderia sp. TJI49]|nr:hypothetical protein B1M_04154 [Burkholderia sp. TJI49]